MQTAPAVLSNLHLECQNRTTDPSYPNERFCYDIAVWQRVVNEAQYIPEFGTGWRSLASSSDRFFLGESSPCRIQGFGGETLRYHLGDPGIDRRIILRGIFRKGDVGIWTGSSWLRIGTGGGDL